MSRKKLSAMSKEISAASRERHCKSGRRGGGRGDRDTEDSEYEAGSYEYWYYGTETGDSQVGE